MEPARHDRLEYGDTSESAILRMAEIIVERFSPMSVMLFGSRARGDADGHSDADLFVIMPEGTDVDSAYLDIRAALRHSPVAKDILVNTPETFAKYAVLPGTVQREVVRKGMLLYGDLNSYAATLLQNAEGRPERRREAGFGREVRGTCARVPFPAGRRESPEVCLGAVRG